MEMLLIIGFCMIVLSVFTQALYASIAVFSDILILTWESICSVMSVIFCNNSVNVFFVIIRHGICISLEKLCKVSCPFDLQNIHNLYAEKPYAHHSPIDSIYFKSSFVRVLQGVYKNYLISNQIITLLFYWIRLWIPKL